MTALAQLPIPTYPSEGGALNWFDPLDSEGRVRLILTANPIPPTPKDHKDWVIKALEESYDQTFFFMPRSLSTAPLDIQLCSVNNDEEVGSAVVCLPLTQLFLLPNERPAEELAHMKAFLTWLDERLKGQNKDGDDATICWARVGKVELQPMYFKDEKARRALEIDLKAWRDQPWFEAWHRANTTALKRLPRGRHFWFDIPSLVPSRRIQRLRELHAPQPSAAPDTGFEDMIVLDI